MKLSQKMEVYSLGLFEGKLSQRDCYTDAGYSPRQSPATLDRNACVLASNPKIVARLKELRQAAEDASVAKVLERQQVLTEIVRGRLTDYSNCGPDKDLIDVGPESPNTAALQEVTSRTEYDKDGAGVAVVTKIKLHNPIQAIAELNKMDHIYEVGGQVRDVNIVFVIGKGYSDLRQIE